MKHEQVWYGLGDAHDPDESDENFGADFRVPSFEGPNDAPVAVQSNHHQRENARIDAKVLEEKEVITSRMRPSFIVPCIRGASFLNFF